MSKQNTIIMNRGGAQATMNSRTPKTHKVAILLENAQWLEDLLPMLTMRQIPYEAVHMDDAALLLDAPTDHLMYFNQVSPSAYLRGHGSALRLTAAVLDTLAFRGVRVLNGANAFKIETSKVSQHLLLKRLGVRVPWTLIFNSREQVRYSAADFPFPAIVKPDTGGSGAHVRYVANLRQLRRLLDRETELFAPDQLLLLQEHIRSEDHSVVRLEYIDGALVYALRVRSSNTFNLCPAEPSKRAAAPGSGQTLEPTVTFECYEDVPADAVAQGREIIRAGGMDIGGVEYIEAVDGQRYFIDINATTVYRQEISTAAGNSGTGLLADFIEREYHKELAKSNPSQRLQQVCC